MSAERLHVVCPHCDTVNRVPRARLGEGGKCGACHRKLFDGTPIELSEPRAQIHLRENQIPFLVDFWAPWCGPCRAMAPHYAAAAQQLEPMVRLAKVNVDEAPAMAAAYQIRNIPTLVLFAGGREIARHAGAQPASELADWVKLHLPPGPR
jgi:thioredoxin 2